MGEIDYANAENLLRARCAECGWEWIVAHLPMEIKKACRLMMRAACPKCAAGTKSVLCMWDEKNPPKPRNPK